MMHDLHLTCLAFAFIDFHSIGVFSVGFLFKNFASMGKPYSSSYKHFCMNSHICYKYIEIISKPEQKVI